MKRPALAAGAGRKRVCYVFNACSGCSGDGRSARARLQLLSQGQWASVPVLTGLRITQHSPGSLFHLNFCQSATVSTTRPPPNSSRPAIRAGPQARRWVAGSERARAWAAGRWGRDVVTISFFPERLCAAHMHGSRQQYCGAGSANQQCAAKAAAALTGGDGQQANPCPQALHGPEEGQAQRVAAGRSKERVSLDSWGCRGGAHSHRASALSPQRQLAAHLLGPVSSGSPGCWKNWSRRASLPTCGCRKRQCLNVD